MEVLYDWQIKMNANKSLRHISEHRDILVFIDVKYINRAKADFTSCMQYIAQ